MKPLLIRSLYDGHIAMAREATGDNDSARAVAEFITILNPADVYVVSHSGRYEKILEELKQQGKKLIRYLNLMTYRGEFASWPRSTPERFLYEVVRGSKADYWGQEGIRGLHAASNQYGGNIWVINHAWTTVTQRIELIAGTAGLACGPGEMGILFDLIATHPRPWMFATDYSQARLDEMAPRPQWQNNVEELLTGLEENRFGAHPRCVWTNGPFRDMETFGRPMILENANRRDGWDEAFSEWANSYDYRPRFGLSRNILEIRTPSPTDVSGPVWQRAHQAINYWSDRTQTPFISESFLWIDNETIDMTPLHRYALVRQTP